MIKPYLNHLCNPIYALCLIYKIVTKFIYLSIRRNQTKYYDGYKNKLSHSISPSLVSYENK